VKRRKATYRIARERSTNGPTPRLAVTVSSDRSTRSLAVGPGRSYRQLRDALYLPDPASTSEAFHRWLHKADDRMRDEVRDLPATSTEDAA
jgi:hypothetical protein